jgi:pimeloyl-ACP methyl ester carboxylesterase
MLQPTLVTGILIILMKNTILAPYRSLITLRTFFVRIIIAVLAVLLLVACGGREEAPITVPADAQAGDLVGLEPCTYTTKDEVEYAADCGTLIVPENRNDSAARLIALPVTRIRATGSNPTEPIFWLTGGPGASNMLLNPPQEAVEDHDMVMVGYRGVDGSVVLDCPQVAKAWRGVGGDLFSDESLANIGQAFARCAARLQDGGVDLDGYTVPEVIEDMEAARIGLGYERVNLLSGSYGTRVAMFYASLYPDSVYRSVMVAVNPPGHFVWEPEVLDDMIAYDAELCAQDPACSARTDDLAESVRNVAHNMPRRWLFIPIDPGKVRVITHFLLFHRRSAATAYDLYLAAEEGDPSGLALTSVMYNFMWPPMNTWGEWANKGSSDYDPGRDWVADMDPQDSVLGSPTSLAIGGQTQLGGGWPATPLPAEFYEVPVSDVETLLVSGSMDFSTPPQFATGELLPVLSKGHQVILSEFGHTGDVWGMQPEAMLHLTTTFYDTGEVDDSLFTYQPMDFHVENGWPAQAKQYLAIAVAVPLVLVALVGLTVWFIIRRVRRRRASQVLS